MDLRTTSLHALHEEAGAALVDFHGWHMPIRYGSIPEEHLACRASAGLFDLGHMGRLRFAGAGAEAWLDRVLTIDVGRLKPGRAKYALALKESGGVIDDTILYRIDAEEWLLVVNASNRDRMVAWLADNRPSDAAAELEDLTDAMGMIAIQGPLSEELTSAVLASPSIPWSDLRYYRIIDATLPAARSGVGEDVPVRVARTGYTGEDGFEVYLPAQTAPGLWRALLEPGPETIRPIGLGARDTLRLEAAMPLYGHELDDTVNPFEAGLDFAVALDKESPFVGREALLAVRNTGPRRRLLGFRTETGRVARGGMKIFRDDQEVGEITSGAPSPTLGHAIALGYVDASVSDDGHPVEVDLRGRRTRLVRETLPFYQRVRST